MMKRLIDSVVNGFGFSAGSALFHKAVDKAVDDVNNAMREPTPEETKKAEAEARKRAIAEQKELAQAAKDAEKARKKEAAEVDAELAALKRKMGK
jgi:phage shock protein A